MALLIHTTSRWSILDILKDGKLRPSCDTGGARYVEECLDDVYFSIFYPFQKFKVAHDVIFFFKPDILKKYNTKHWNPGWAYGKFVKKMSIKYNKKKTPEENIEIWENEYKKYDPVSVYQSGHPYDEVVVKDTVDLDDSLIAIFIDKLDMELIGGKSKLPPGYNYITSKPALYKFLKERNA